MIQTKLITGGRQSERLSLAREMIKEHLGHLQHPDLLMVEAIPSITINQVRELKKRLARKPYSAPIKIVFLPEAEKITFPAQNALLKTLEEPPGKALIILLAAKKEALLPTIISRCEIIQLPEKPAIEIDKKLITHYSLLITKILNSRVGQRLILAEEYSQNRQEAIDFCQKQLIVWRELLRQNTLDTPGVGECHPPEWGIQKHTGSGPFDSAQGKLLSPGVRGKQQTLTPSQITATLRHLHQALIYLDANVNHRLVVENLLLNYPALANFANQ